MNEITDIVPAKMTGSQRSEWLAANLHRGVEVLADGSCTTMLDLMVRGYEPDTGVHRAQTPHHAAALYGEQFGLDGVHCPSPEWPYSVIVRLIGPWPAIRAMFADYYQDDAVWRAAAPDGVRS